MYDIQYESVLAKLMSSENLTVQYDPRQKTASFDVKNRILMLPVVKSISREARETFTVHEVGHALYTPSDFPSLCRNAGVYDMSLVNIFEDVRVERLMKKKFPGSSKVMSSGWKDMFFGKFFCRKDSSLFDSPKKMIENQSKLHYLDRINIFAKVGLASKFVLNRNETALFDKAFACESFEDVIALCLEVQAKQREENRLEEQNSGNSSSGAQNQTEEAPDSSDSEESEQGETDAQDSGSDEESDSVDDQVSSPIKDETDPADESTDGEKSAEVSTKLQPFTNDIFHKNIEDCVDHTEFLPVFDIDEFIANVVTNVDNREKFNSQMNAVDNSYLFLIKDKFKNTLDPIAQDLANDFLVRLETANFALQSNAQSGDLDMNRIWEYQTSDRLFMDEIVTHSIKNHGLVISIDCSSSMLSYGKSVNAINNLYVLARFATIVDIPFEVVFFGFQRYGTVPYIKTKKVKYNSTSINFCIGLSSSNSWEQNLQNLSVLMAISKDQYGEVARLVPYSFGSTPLFACDMIVSKLIAELKENNQIQKVCYIRLTDGEDNSKFSNLPSNKFLDVKLNDIFTMSSKEMIRLIKSYNSEVNVINYYLVSSKRDMGSQVSKKQRDSLKPDPICENIFRYNDGYSDLSMFMISYSAVDFNNQKKFEYTSFLRSFLEIFW